MRLPVIVILIVALAGTPLAAETGADPEADSSDASVTITADAPAKIYINNAYIGETPLEGILLKPGEYKLKAIPSEDWLEEIDKKLLLEENDRLELGLGFIENSDYRSKRYIVNSRSDADADEKASVNITSSASDTTLIVSNKQNQVYKGTTPIEGLGLKPALYTFKSEAEDYQDVDFELDIVSGTIYDIEVYPERTPSAESRRLLMLSGIVFGGIVVVASIIYLLFTNADWR
ncbi:MAG: hypothetical protein GY771_17455 [bacterium]|nr:hypothetical protein [bacterium]